MCTESKGFWIWINCDRTGTKGFKFWKKPDSNPYLENRHINFKLSKLDHRFSQKGRAGQHWLKPMTYFEVASKLSMYKCSLCRWPKCEHITLFFTFSDLKISKFSNVHTLRAHQIVPLRTQMFSNGFEFPATKSIPKLMSSSENCEIEFYFIKSDSQRPFQKHQECPQIPIQFSVTIWFSFH